MENKNKYNNSKKSSLFLASSLKSSKEKERNSKQSFRKDKFSKQGSNSQQSRSRVLSLTQLLSRLGKSHSNITLTSNEVTKNSVQMNDITLMSGKQLDETKGGKNNKSISSLNVTGATNRQGVASIGSRDQKQRFRNSGMSSLAQSATPQSGKGEQGKAGGMGISSFSETRSVSEPLPQRGRAGVGSYANNNFSRTTQTRLEREEQKRQTPIKPIIPPKSLIIVLKEKPEKILYNRRIIDYKHCGLLQRYIGLGGKILPRRQTRLTAKQQRYIAKTIKSARIMGLLPFVSKEKSFYKY